MQAGGRKSTGLGSSGGRSRCTDGTLLTMHTDCNSDSRSPGGVGKLKTAPGAVLFLILCKRAPSSFYPNPFGEGAIFNHSDGLTPP